MRKVWGLVTELINLLIDNVLEFTQFLRKFWKLLYWYQFWGTCWWRTSMAWSNATPLSALASSPHSTWTFAWLNWNTFIYAFNISAEIATREPRSHFSNDESLLISHLFELTDILGWWFGFLWSHTKHTNWQQRGVFAKTISKIHIGSLPFAGLGVDISAMDYGSWHFLILDMLSTLILGLSPLFYSTGQCTWDNSRGDILVETNNCGLKPWA